MRRSIAGLVALVFASAASTACTLIAGDLSFLEGNGADAAVEDGASLDGSFADARAFDGATIDATASDARFCDSLNPAPQFCADFDNENPLSAFKLSTGKDASVTLQADAYSPPFALQSSLHQNDIAAASADSGTPTTSVTFNARYRIDATPTHANTHLFNLYDASNTYNLFLVVEGGITSLWFSDDNVTQGQILNKELGGTTAISAGDWHFVEVTVDLTTNPISITAKLDGKIFCADTVSTFTATGSAANIGLGYESDTTLTTVSYDNVVLYVQ